MVSARSGSPATRYVVPSISTCFSLTWSVNAASSVSLRRTLAEHWYTVVPSICVIRLPVGAPA